MTENALPHDILVDYASGTASPAVALLVATHLTHSPEGRRSVARLEALGGALLADEPAAEMSTGALDSILSRLDEPPAEPPEDRPEDTGPLPAPLSKALGIPFSDIPWSFRLPGLAEHEMQGFGDDQHVSLLRARPGARIPQHTHRGVEMTLVLAGQLEDAGRVYGPGDVAINTDADDHKPTIVGEETCYCLVVMDGRMHFTGTFSRFLNLLGD